MTMPRSLPLLGVLFGASFLATWLVVRPGDVPMAHAARTLLVEMQAQGPAAAPAWRETVPQGAGSPHEKVGASDAPEAPPDFEAAARDAVAGATVEARVRATQVLAEAPEQQGLDALVTASAQGGDAMERGSALASLRQRLGSADRDARIHDAFRQAAADPDPLVAVIAQSALEGSSP